MKTIDTAPHLPQPKIPGLNYQIEMHMLCSIFFAGAVTLGLSKGYT